MSILNHLKEMIKIISGICFLLALSCQSQNVQFKFQQFFFFSINPDCRLYVDSTIKLIDHDEIRALVITQDKTLDELFKYKNIEYIEVRNCRISEIKKKFGSKLLFIEIYDSEICDNSLFDNIINSNMISIDIEKCSISNYKWVSRFKELMRMSLVQVNLGKIPLQIQKLHNLKILNMSSNYISALNKRLFVKPNLIRLYISNNTFEKLPKINRVSSSLEVIDLSDNLSFEGKNLCIFTNSELKELYLDNCSIDFFPKCLVKVSSLVNLFMSENKIDFIPNDIYRDEKDEDLWIHISGNFIHKIPLTGSNIVIFTPASQDVE